MVTVLIAVFFMTQAFVYPAISALSIILCYLLVKTKGKIRCPGIIIIFACYGSLILIQMLIEPSGYFGFEIALKELSRLCIYALVVLIAANTRIREECFLRVWRFAFLFSMLIAIGQFAKIGAINQTLVTVYGDSRHWVSATYSGLDLFRAGSVFINANTYAQFISMILAIFLATDQGKRNNRMRSVLFAIAIMVSLLLAGSRTGIVIAALVLISSAIRNLISKRGQIRIGNLLILTILSSIGIVGIAMYLNTKPADSTGFRAFRITAGIGSSLGYKFSTFRSMINQFTALNWFIGMGVMETDIKYVTKIDFDLGYMAVFYGIVGCVLYVWALHNICHHRDKMSSRYVYLNRLLALIVVLSGLTAGLFFDLRVFSMFATVFYADIVDAHFQPIQRSSPNGM